MSGTVVVPRVQSDDLISTGGTLLKGWDWSKEMYGKLKEDKEMAEKPVQIWTGRGMCPCWIPCPRERCLEN